ncbi:hypothetical protein BS47DRAFT_1486102 [Hydnum rufescens UP504]|uniref:Uncharacterized protein n=1 Tax=Hydnum rufescens UP504 TaxID=1448309 RepID=A0A9P6AVI0_9AGAM|nr:hypothetical protein BS47DRAFT_1486102 [Hydnum rufescens UP504]
MRASASKFALSSPTSIDINSEASASIRIAGVDYAVGQIRHAWLSYPIFMQLFLHASDGSEYLADPIQQLMLGYGANPHQKPAQAFVKYSELPFRVLAGSPGYINLLEALSSYAPRQGPRRGTLPLAAGASFKHVSPADAAVGLELNDVEKKSTVAMVSKRS